MTQPPVSGSQTARWQSSRSGGCGQTTAAPPAQTPAWQVGLTRQRLSQGVSSANLDQDSALRASSQTQHWPTVGWISPARTQTPSISQKPPPTVPPAQIPFWQVPSERQLPSQAVPLSRNDHMTWLRAGSQTKQVLLGRVAPAG